MGSAPRTATTIIHTALTNHDDTCRRKRATAVGAGPGRDAEGQPAGGVHPGHVADLGRLIHLSSMRADGGTHRRGARAGRPHGPTPASGGGRVARNARGGAAALVEHVYEADGPGVAAFAPLRVGRRRRDGSKVPRRDAARRLDDNRLVAAEPRPRLCVGARACSPPMHE